MLRDFQYAIRGLRKAPGFAAIAVSILAVGIGANTAVFSALNSLLIRPLPYADPLRLAIVGELNAKRGLRTGVSRETFARWRTLASSFAGIAAIQDDQVFPLPGNTDSLHGSRVSANFFQVLGVEAKLGRTFTADDGRPNAANVVLISDELWRRRWNADTGVLGTTLEMANRNWTIVGVLPPGFRMLYANAGVWVPLDAASAANRYERSLFVIARLKTGTSLKQAQDQLTSLSQSLAKDAPETYTDWSVWAQPLREYFIGNRRPLALVLLATVALVLLTACLNLATLLIARATGHLRELAIRLSLGATRWHLVRQALAESLVIAGVGAAAGLLITKWIREIAIASVPELRDLVIDVNVLIFTCGVAVVCALVMAFGPALVGRNAIERGAARRGSRLRSAFVVAQTAIAVALLISANVLLRSFSRLHATDPGFRSAGILVAELSIPDGRYAADGDRARFARDLLARTAGASGVRAVAAATTMPLFGITGATFEIDGRGREEQVPVAYRSITPNYFRVFEVPLRRGRHLDERDSEGAPRVVVVNERTARLFWPDADPIGQRIRFGKRGWATVVGVAADIRSIGLRRPAIPEVFAPYAQEPTGQLSIALRTEGDPLAILPALRNAAHTADREVAITYANSMSALLDEQLVLVRALSAFSSSFAAIAALLAAIGLYGVVSCLFAQRTREIGIRAALGATRQDIIKIVAGSSARLAVWGVLAGNIVGYLFVRLFNSALFGVAGVEPVVFLYVTAILIVVEAAAVYTPARRAALVEPAVALRCE